MKLAEEQKVRARKGRDRESASGWRAGIYLEQERLARSRTRALELARRRAKVILMLSAGGTYSEISKRLGCTVDYISYWRGRFKQNRLISATPQNLSSPAALHR